MKILEVYFDNSATTQPFNEVIEEISSVMKNNYGNPSSIHRKGIDAEKVLKNSRQIIADSLNVKSKEVIFTSGGTESNNIAIKGVLSAKNRQGKHIISSLSEHDSVFKILEDLQIKDEYNISFLKPDRYGKVLLKQVSDAIREDTVLVSLMHINNELGAQNPIHDIGKKLKSDYPQIHFHVDAVQSYMKYAIDPYSLGIDSLSISSHKIHGPKGTGALYLSERARINPLFYGGGQERNLRSGTENTPGIAGFARAVNMQKDSIIKNREYLNGLKNRFIEMLERRIKDITINSEPEGCGHILNISFLGVRGEILLHSLEQKGIYVSTGSACSSKKKGSRILETTGMSNLQKEGAIRFSFSTFNTSEEIDYTVDQLEGIIENLRKILKYKTK